MTYKIQSTQIFIRSCKLSIFAATSSILTAALILLSVNSATASEDKQNYVAPSIGFFGGNTLYGVNAKFGIAENFALRPFIQSRNSGTATGTAYGASFTYNFQIPSSGLIPYLGIGAAEVYSTGTARGNGGIYFEGGVDYNASDSFVINANYKSAADTWINIGAGYRF